MEATADVVRVLHGRARPGRDKKAAFQGWRRKTASSIAILRRRWARTAVYRWRRRTDDQLRLGYKQGLWDLSVARIDAADARASACSAAVANEVLGVEIRDMEMLAGDATGPPGATRTKGACRGREADVSTGEGLETLPPGVDGSSTRGFQPGQREAATVRVLRSVERVSLGTALRLWHVAARGMAADEHRAAANRRAMHGVLGPIASATQEATTLAQVHIRELRAALASSEERRRSAEGRCDESLGQVHTLRALLRATAEEADAVDALVAGASAQAADQAARREVATASLAEADAEVRKGLAVVQGLRRTCLHLEGQLHEGQVERARLAAALDAATTGMASARDAWVEARYKANQQRVVGLQRAFDTLRTRFVRAAVRRGRTQRQHILILSRELHGMEAHFTATDAHRAARERHLARLAVRAAMRLALSSRALEQRHCEVTSAMKQAEERCVAALKSADAGRQCARLGEVEAQVANKRAAAAEARLEALVLAVADGWRQRGEAIAVKSKLSRAFLALRDSARAESVRRLVEAVRGDRDEQRERAQVANASERALRLAQAAAVRRIEASAILARVRRAVTSRKAAWDLGARVLAAWQLWTRAELGVRARARWLKETRRDALARRQVRVLSRLFDSTSAKLAAALPACHCHPNSM